MNQDFPQDRYEVIVVDGESNDRTPEIIEAFQQRYPGRIHFLSNPRRTLATGWNIGIQHSEGEYVIRVDGHSQIPANFLSSTYRVAQRVPEASCVGGIVETKGTGFWGEVNAYVYSHPFGVGNSKFRTTKTDWEGYVDTVPYAAYKREIFDEVGYFDENLKRNEDLEMHSRIRRNGGSFFLSTAIRSTYFVRNTLCAFLKKSYSDGKWTIVASKQGMDVLRWRHYIPLIVVLMSIILGAASFFSPVALISLFALIGIYIVLLVGSSWGIVKEKGWKAFFPCMMSFFLLHFSRGFGSAASFLSKQYWRGDRDRVHEEGQYDGKVTNVAR
ncbi:glycosyl transferase family 2 [Melghirimyces profundicolus]|uniref:Glycosyl transferase family 2 n=2 Tax=Melghirimyces profundicolus TaxID=1242148 RepID=A0A2T6B3N2_9BACL|nr:glycosyl transferase family 2 [Melghirimyces profundicolus]